MLVDHVLELVRTHANLVHQNVIMSRTRGTLDCGVRVQVEIILERVSDVFLNQRAGERILTLVTSRAREEADVMTLRGHNNSEFDLSRMSGLDLRICQDEMIM